MKISFTVWCTLIDLFGVKKEEIKKDDFKIFAVSECTLPFYEALFCTAPLMFEIILDEFNTCTNYTHDHLIQKISEELTKCFNKKITFQFCIYRY